MKFTEFLTWDIIATYTGAAAVTAMLTQFFKEFIKIPTQLFSYLLALILLNISYLALSKWTFKEFGLIFINAILVSLTANGGYSAIIRTIKNEKKDN